MPIASMTGFARTEGESGSTRWVWELKSVNGKGLDIRCRLPQGSDALDALVRAAIAERCRRGNISVTLTVSHDDRESRLTVNEDLLNQLLDLADRYTDRLHGDRPRFEGLLGVRGVLETAEHEEGAEESEARAAAMGQSFHAALDRLTDARRVEGDKLETVVRGLIEDITGSTAAAAETGAAQPESLRRRLLDQIAPLLEALPALPEERIAQEVALLASKADIQEEIDRLKAHCDAATTLVDEGGPVGRRLDFLCQEFNREANTICSKSGDIALTRIGLDLKASIDRLREQVQNIE